MEIPLEWLAIVSVAVFLGVGIKNFLAIARAAGITYNSPGSGWRIYRYAFTEMRHSKETRTMVVGFAGAVIEPVVLYVVQHFQP